MKIKRFADILGISPQTLRNYEKKGILVPNKLPSGYRIYTKHHLEEAVQRGMICKEDAEKVIKDEF